MFRTIRRILVVAAITVLLGAIGISNAEEANPILVKKVIDKKPKKIETLKIGAKAPDFKLPGVDGKTYTLKSFAKADILVVVFTCNHCPTAQAYEDRINRIAKDYRQKGVALAAISPNDPEAVSLAELGYSDMSDSLIEMKVRAREKGFEFPYLYDGEKQKVSEAYGPRTTPHVFIFDAERRLRYVGRIDDSEKPGTAKVHDTRNAIEALLASKPVPVEETNTFGCSIKWSSKRKNVKQQLKLWADEEVALQSIDIENVKKLLKNDSKNLRFINFWTTWCGPCIMEFPALVTINRMYRNRNFEMITISMDTPSKKDDVLSFLKKYQASAKNYIYNSEDIYTLVGSVGNGWQGGIPFTVVVEPGGKILYSGEGMIDPRRMTRMIVGYLGRYYE
jgi:peroxiredoxin